MKGKKKRAAAKKSSPPQSPEQHAGLTPATPPIITDLEEFQATYGLEYSRLVQTPALWNGLLLLNKRKMSAITTLTDEQIERNGREILSDLRGHLNLERQLLTLHEMREFKLPVEQPEVYVSPEQQVEHEQMLEKFRKENEEIRHAR